MNEKFKIFSADELGSVRVCYKEDGSIWFVANDVCNILEIKNMSDAIKRLDDDEKSGVALTDPHGRVQETRVVNESGLYTLILASRKPSAKPFKRWITHEVIPSIRKNGGYIMGQEELSASEMDELRNDIKALSSKVKKLQKRRHELIKENKSLTETKRRFKKELAAVNDYADLLEHMYEILERDYEKAVQCLSSFKKADVHSPIVNPDAVITSSDSESDYMITSEGFIIKRSLFRVNK